MIAYKLLLIVDVCLCCAGGGGGGYTAPFLPDPGVTVTTVNDGTVDRQATYGGFDIPADKLEQWRNWYTSYMVNQTKANEKQFGPGQHPYDPGFGMPDSWAGLTIGHGGFPPQERPPWSYTFKKTGLPSFCYQPLARGSCRENIERWAYNPDEDMCVSFNFTGCEGNENHFRSLEKCHEWCMTKTPDPCDWKTDISRESTLIDPMRRSSLWNKTRKCGY